MVPEGEKSSQGPMSFRVNVLEALLGYCHERSINVPGGYHAGRQQKPEQTFMEELKEKCVQSESYHGQVNNALLHLSKSVQCSMKITALLKRPGSTPLKEIMEPAVQQQLEDVATGQTMITLLTEMQRAADMQAALKKDFDQNQKAQKRPAQPSPNSHEQQRHKRQRRCERSSV